MSPGDNQPRLLQVDATSGDSRRRPAAVRTHLQGTGHWFEPSCATSFPAGPTIESRKKLIGMLVLADVEDTRRGNTMLIMKHGHMVRYALR